VKRFETCDGSSVIVTHLIYDLYGLGKVPFKTLYTTEDYWELGSLFSFYLFIHPSSSFLLQLPVLYEY